MSIGGTQQVIRQLLENNCNTGVNSEIVCLDNQIGDLGQLLLEKGYKIHLLNRREGIDIYLLLKLRKLIILGNFNIVHCHQYTPYTYGLLASLFTKAKVIFTEHGRFYPDFGTWKRKLLNPLFSFFTFRITSISNATKKALVEHENFPSKSIDIIYNGLVDNSTIDIDTSSLKSLYSISPSDVVFGSISRIEPIKNQKLMIRAFKRLRDLNQACHLLIVGDGDIRKDLEYLTNDLGISDSVTFTGFQREPYKFHKIIDVFLLSSFSEGTSMTLLEAMSFSKPCVVTSVGGNPELINDTINGFLVPVNNEELFFDACHKLLEDKELRKRMGEQSRMMYQNNFTIKHMIYHYDELYRSTYPNNNYQY
jgi:glycosyltransferase involved in cell wall biosynthesis